LIASTGESFSISKLRSRHRILSINFIVDETTLFYEELFTVLSTNKKILRFVKEGSFFDKMFKNDIFIPRD